MVQLEELLRLRKYIKSYASTIDKAAQRPGRREHQLADGLATPILMLDCMIQSVMDDYK